MRENQKSKIKNQNGNSKFKNKNFGFLYVILHFEIWILILGFVFTPQLHAAIWDALTQADIPIYPAMQKTSEQNLTVNGVRMKMVFLKAENMSISQAVQYYKKVLGQRGWQTQGEMTLPDNSVVINFMSKDQRMCSLQFLSGSMVNKPSYVLVRMMYTLEGIGKWQAALPTDSTPTDSTKDMDMAGEDIPWLKRYPQSIRTHSTSDDQGYITISYTLPNYNCMECVASFYSQQMTQKGWTLMDVKLSTQDQLHARSQSLDKTLEESLKVVESKLEMAMPTMPEEVLQYLGKNDPERAQKLKETIGEYLKHSLKQSAQAQIPEATKKLSFRKGSNLCTIIINHNSPNKEDSRSQLLDLMGVTDEQKEIYGKYMQELAQKNRTAYHMGLQSQERVDIVIMYIPESKLKERAKPWF